MKQLNSNFGSNNEGGNKRRQHFFFRTFRKTSHIESFQIFPHYIFANLPHWVSYYKTLVPTFFTLLHLQFNMRFQFYSKNKLWKYLKIKEAIKKIASPRLNQFYNQWSRPQIKFFVLALNAFNAKNSSMLISKINKSNFKSYWIKHVFLIEMCWSADKNL